MSGLKEDREEWFARLQKYIERADLYQATAEAAADHLGTPVTTLHHRLRYMGQTYFKIKQAERTARLLEQLDDAPESTPGFLTELCGFGTRAGFVDFFVKTMGMTINQWREKQGFPRTRVHKTIGKYNDE